MLLMQVCASLLLLETLKPIYHVQWNYRLVG